MIGRVIKSLSGDFDVIGRGEIYTCRGRGKIQHDDDKLLVGDIVEFDPSEKSVERILPRKNKIARPYVANIDLIIVVCAAIPKTDLMLVDKLILQCRINKIDIVLCCNKSDLGAGVYDEFVKQFSGCVDGVVDVSAKTGAGVAALKDLLTGKLSCLCGQSGGGKSSLLNAILGHDANDTSAVSLRSERGRHTTRHTEIFTLGADTFIIDTPGFSFLEPEGIDCKELDLYFPDLLELGVRCKYPRCTHRGEPECAVKTAVEQGAFSRERLERFVKLYGELHEMSGKY